MGRLSVPGLEPGRAVTMCTQPSSHARQRLTTGTLKLREKATLENMACDTRPARQGSRRALTVRWAEERPTGRQDAAALRAGERCIASIEPGLASTTSPSRRDQDGGARDGEDDEARVRV